MSTSSADSGGSNGSHYFSSSSRARSYKCKVCGNEFNSGQSLGGHMNVHRKDQRSPRNEHSSSRSSTPPGGDYYSSTSDSSSTYKGVRYRSEQNKWVAEIRPPKSNKTWWLGTYSTAVEAAYAYDVAITYFGSETSLNFDGHPVYDQIPRISPTLPKQDFAVQLRKVVKEYGKLAMQSDERGELEFDAPTPSYGAHDQYNSQQEEYVMREFDEIDWDEFPATFPDAGTPESLQISSSYDAPFDFDMPPVTYNEPESGYYNGYQPNEPSFYNHMSSAISDYEPNGYNYNGYQSAQQQFWPPYCNQYNSY